MSGCSLRGVEEVGSIRQVLSGRLGRWKRRVQKQSELKSCGKDMRASSLYKAYCNVSCTSQVNWTTSCVFVMFNGLLVHLHFTR
ncbi:hypothetical protein J6590_060502 [Homalodisca vitripennis]|nr:hypothetical protein J6590_060502 [Homalodisca vitripennis]